ncbi:glycosyltransferase family 2 protein [Natranaerobius trueperi]|uniref:glycosyltransferase family 2 protein n=1 Tax=Natranaerobius trueperi TaxID=759412 RepID=UPI001303CEF8|nr:glycosyltransferase family 2 protein [Natranaerobius trueperi]
MLCVVWIVGSLYYWRKYETSKEPYPFEESFEWPYATIMVPCRNEEANIRLTTRALRNLNYNRYQVLFIDDHSTDDTVSIIQEEISGLDNFHLLRLKNNLGKAKALNQALKLVYTPVTVVIDADTILSEDALFWLIHPLMFKENTGAVTGNPYAFNRFHLIEKQQTAEFASIIGLIKRAQCMIGKLLTVSGCVSAFRTDALQTVKGFSSCTATEDIDSTWRIQKQGYNVWFEPRAITFIRVPSTIKAYWKQRTRWSLGGWHLLRKHSDVFKNRKWRSLWPIYLEFSLGYLWAFCFIIGTLLWVLTISFNDSKRTITLLTFSMIR